MPKFAANITMLFTEMPIFDRFAAAADTGFDGVEILYPYDIKAPLLRRAAKAADVKVVLINSPPPNWSGDARGFAAVPGLEQRFRHDFDRVLHYAHALRAVHISVLSGVTSDPAARVTFVENLTWAAERAPHTSLLIEPVGQGEQPGAYLSNFDLAVDIISEIGAPNLGLQFDIAHAHAIIGDVTGAWMKYAPHIRHIQIAGLPDRREPSHSNFDLAGFFTKLDQFGYRGWVGAEYSPNGMTETSLGWMP